MNKKIILFSLTTFFLASQPCFAIMPTTEIKTNLQNAGLYYGILNNLTNVAALDKAIASGVYLFVKIGADWCNPCKKLEPIIKQLAIENKDVLFIEINFDSFKTIANRYGVKSIPTVLLFNNGNLISKNVGTQTKSFWETLIKNSFGI